MEMSILAHPGSREVCISFRTVLRPAIALEGSLGYTYTQESFKNEFQVFDDDHSVIDLNIGVQIFLGSSGE